MDSTHSDGAVIPLSSLSTLHEGLPLPRLLKEKKKEGEERRRGGGGAGGEKSPLNEERIRTSTVT